MGRPERVRTLSRHEIEDITALSLREIGGSVSRDYYILCETIERTF